MIQNPNKNSIEQNLRFVDYTVFILLTGNLQALPSEKYETLQNAQSELLDQLLQRASLKQTQQKLLSAFEQRDITQLQTFASAGERNEMQRYISESLRGVLGASPNDLAETEQFLTHAFTRVALPKNSGTRQYALKLDEDQEEGF